MGMVAADKSREIASEAEWLAAIRSFEPLDHPAGGEFDELVELAAQVCGAPIGILSGVDDQGRWFKASFGVAVQDTGREASFCSHAVRGDGLFVVEDTARDPLLAGTSLLPGGPPVRFFASMPIARPGELPLGILCVMDVAPRKLNDCEERSLGIIAQQVSKRLQQRFDEREAALLLVDHAQFKLRAEQGRRIQAEVDLVQANDMLHSVLESTLDSIITLDAEWIIRYMNGNAMQMPSGRVVGLSFWDAFPGLRGSIAESSLIHCMATRESTEYEIYYAPFARWYRVFANASADGISLFYQDITIEKELAEQLERERTLRERKIAALSHMAGGLAHEISSPLTIIHALVSDLRDASSTGRPVSNRLVQTTCQETLETADRASRILRGLRAFARDSSQEPLEDIPLARIAERAIELQQERFVRSLIALKLTDASAMQRVPCREVQIIQIVTNLLSNAFDAIDAANPRLRSVEILVESNGTECFLTVRDSGPGIPAEDRTRLMTTFFTTKGVGAGMGVGLSLSRAIAEDHKGTLALEDGLPTSFRLTLPATPHQETHLPVTQNQMTENHMKQNRRNAAHLIPVEEPERSAAAC